MDIQPQRISCIIAAHNEGPRIGAVLKVIYGHPLIDEVVVINDGSTDDTGKVLEMYQDIHVISQYPNGGKTLAVMKGIRASKNNIVMLIDADLIGLSADDISNLASPVLSGNADVSISIRKNSFLVFKIAGVDFVSGERVFYKKTLGDISALSTLPKFGLEVYMNTMIIKNHLRIKVVKWGGVYHARKMEKMGWFKGARKEFSMLFEIASTIKISSLFSQILQLRSLRVE